MTSQTLTINARHFLLPDETNIIELEHRIEEAARLGGSMIVVPGAATATSALITPATTVFLDAVGSGTHPGPEENDLTENYDVDLDTVLRDRAGS